MDKYVIEDNTYVPLSTEGNDLSFGVKKTCDDFKREAVFTASTLSDCVSKEETAEKFKLIYLSGIANDRFVTALYLKDGVFYNPEGKPVYRYNEVDDLKEAEEPELSKVFQYENKIMTIAAFAKISEGYAGGVAVLFDREKLNLTEFKPDGKMAA